MSKTIYTPWVSKKYKKKTYYIRGWMTYTLSETQVSKFITFTAGFQTKKRAYNSTQKLTLTVSDTLGHKKSNTAKFSGGSNKTKSVTYISKTTWKYDKGTSDKTITANLISGFGKTIFSGKKSNKALSILVSARTKPQVSFVAERTSDSVATLKLTVTTDRQVVVTQPTITRNGTPITPTWDANFPLSIPAGTTVFTASDSVDPMHDFDYSYTGIAGTYTYNDASSIDAVHQPEWRVSSDDPSASETAEGEPAVIINADLPDVNYLNNAVINVYAYDYVKGIWTLLPNDDGWQIEAVDDTHWKLPLKLSEQYVASSTSQNTTAKIKITYTTYTTSDVIDNVAIFNTNRNANFSTGLANNIFIGGCTVTDYSSRVWYSAVNNPLYIPDINYIEVGSNDTRVMGLVKVGDYLGVIKQSKSIDSSVFLVYPTSFEDQTTFATKACVSGVGALGQYCFNVLGDETLFLSPRGVMAIEPSEDEASRVKDRSYYVNGRLLEEVDLEKAYSFVWNGYYMLAVNNHVYVLDGNQRNSWGNQKTNLVYECYFLYNVPAKILFSYDGELWFADFNGNLCRFKDESDEEPYMDETEPVVARWATIADDDNAIHYLKNLEKKGTVVSLLPEKGTTARVYINKDDAIGKDDGIMPVVESDPIPEGTILPPSVYPRKKVKKYKRLQFIVEDATASPFGVNKIIKSYTVGNYAKK
jgi:hypothetical protein